MTLPAFRVAAADVARQLNPWRTLVAVKLVFDDGSEIMLPVGVEPETPVSQIATSDKQRKIIAALLDGPCKADVLAKRAGYSSATTLYQGKGINQLREMGLISLSVDDGYALTPDGERLAADLAE